MGNACRFATAASRAKRGKAFIFPVLGALSFVIGCAACAGQATTSAAQPPASATQATATATSCLPIMPLGTFGDHEIGTTTPQTLDVTNCTDGTTNFAVNLSGSNTDDFSWNSTCLNNVSPKGHCTIVVVFSPYTIGKDKGEGEARTATLTISGGSVQHQDLSLTGKAFQNVAVSPAVVEFENQVGNSSSVARSVVLTNYTGATVSSITVTATGDFSENHSPCVNIAPGASCAISLTYSPKLAGNASGSLTITTNQSNLGKSPRVVLLHGVGLTHCNVPARPWWNDYGLWLVVFISGFYFFGLVLVRWHMIAKPARAQIVAEIEAVRSRAVAETARMPDSPDLNTRLGRIHHVLDNAVYPFKHRHFPVWLNDEGRRNPITELDNREPDPITQGVNKVELAVLSVVGVAFLILWLLGMSHRFSIGGWLWLLLIIWLAALTMLVSRSSQNTSAAWYPWPTRLFNALFWTRGQELASWNLIHEAELQLVALIPLQRVRARLETADQELRELNTKVTLALADRIYQSLTSEASVIEDRSTELLQQLLPLLEPLSVPESALSSLVVDYQQRTVDALQTLVGWIQENTSAAGDLGECKTRLQQFLKSADTCAELAEQIDQLLSLPRLPDRSKEMLQRIASFFSQELSPRILSIQAQSGDPQLTLNACNASLASLGSIGTDAGNLIGELKEAIPPEQGKAFRGLLDLCKSQAALIQAVTQAISPRPGSALLQKILDALQPQGELIQEINSAAAGGADIGSCRDLLTRLAGKPSVSPDLIGQIHCLLRAEALSLLSRWRALLVEALSLIYDNTDNGFSQLAIWHNKMIWLVGCALLFIFALALTLQNAILLLVGAVGGLLSRLQRTMGASDVANDYGATWGALFLSPLTGALSAWGGILLIILGLKFNILGNALNVDWCNPYDTVTLALALLFGFMERLFDGIAGELQNKLVKASTGPTTPAPPAAASSAPRITVVFPPNVVIGREVQLKVSGENFQSGATAMVTDETGKPQSARAEFRDSNTVIVTFTPTGAKAFTAILTIANPDKQMATTKFDVKTA